MCQLNNISRFIKKKVVRTDTFLRYIQGSFAAVFTFEGKGSLETRLRRKKWVRANNLDLCEKPLGGLSECYRNLTTPIMKLLLHFCQSFFALLKQSLDSLNLGHS